MAQLSGGDAVVEVLQRAGVEILFGIPSVHNLPIYDALARRPGIRALTVRHEQAAVGAADAFARTTSSLGVAVTSTGPGAANAMGGLLEAYVSGTPVLHITGQIETRYLDAGRGFIHEVPDQPAMLNALSKRTLRAASADDIPAVVARAIATALDWPRGPVSVELPIDLQYADLGPQGVEALGAVERFPPTRPFGPPSPDAVRRAARMIAGARRPLIWAGGGAIASGAWGEVHDLARLLGAGVITSPNGRGVIPETDPLCIGNLSWDPGVRRLCLDADLLVAVGTRYQGPNTENWSMQLPPAIVQIDLEPQRPALNYPAAVAVQGDAREAIAAVLEELGAGAGAGAAPAVVGAEPSWPGRVAATTSEARARLRSTLGAQLGLFEATQRAVPPGTVVVKDSTIPAYTWGNRLLTVTRPRTSVMPNGFAIGLGLPHAVGAATAARLAGGGPVVLMVGDGGLAQSLGELATLVAEDLPAVVVCFNDGGYGILRNIQQRQYRRTLGVELGRPQLAKVAEAFGMPAVRVGTNEEYEAALVAALQREGPSFIEVDLEAIGPMATPYTGTTKPPPR